MISTRKQYDSIFVAIRKIVKEIDPPGLVKGGAPENEYDIEIAKIVPLIDKISDVDLLAQKIFEIFSLSLGNDAGEIIKYKEIAGEILKKYSKKAG